MYCKKQKSPQKLYIIEKKKKSRNFGCLTITYYSGVVRIVIGDVFTSRNKTYNPLLHFWKLASGS